MPKTRPAPRRLKLLRAPDSLPAETRARLWEARYEHERARSALLEVRLRGMGSLDDVGDYVPDVEALGRARNQLEAALLAWIHGDDTAMRTVVDRARVVGVRAEYVRKLLQCELGEMSARRGALKEA